MFPGRLDFQFFGLIVFVLNFADDLFQDILNGHDAGCAAVFVNDHGNLSLALHQVP